MPRPKKVAGSLKASQIKDAVDLTYVKDTDEAPRDYVIDKELSDGRVKVFTDVNSPQVIVAHRGSKGIRDWIDNIRYGLTGQMNTTETFKKHEKKHQKALDKYGAENVIAIGHSRAGKYVENLNEKQPVKEVITYNKASGPFDLFRKNAENQTDVRSGIDIVSALAPLQKHINKIVTIPTKTYNLLKAHSTMPLNQLGDKLIGKGLKKKNYKPEVLPPLISDLERKIQKMKKDELIDFATSMDIDVNERMKKQTIIDMILENEGIEHGTRYHYKTDYPSCETIIREVYKCYGDNSNLKQDRDELKELKKQLEAVNERIRRLRRQTFSNDPKMRRDDERDMKTALKLKQQVEKNIKIAEKKILELEYQCQRQIYGLIDCEKYRVKRPGDEEIEIEKPEDWEERNKRFLPKIVEFDFDENEPEVDDENELEETKDDLPLNPKGVRFGEDIKMEFENDPQELKDRKKYNYCIKKRYKLNNIKLPELKEILLKLKPDYDMKGKRKRDIIAEILKIKKCDKLIDVRSYNKEEIEIDGEIEFDDDEFLEEPEYVIDDVTYEDIKAVTKKNKDDEFIKLEEFIPEFKYVSKGPIKRNWKLENIVTEYVKKNNDKPTQEIIEDIEEEYDFNTDPFIILGLTEDSTLDDLKKSFRQKALKYHPDKQIGKSEKVIQRAEIMFKIVNNAYNNLAKHFTKYIEIKKRERETRERYERNTANLSEEQKQRQEELRKEYEYRAVAVEEIADLVFALLPRSKEILIRYLMELLERNNKKVLSYEAYKKRTIDSLLFQIINNSGYDTEKMFFFQRDLDKIKDEYKEYKKQETKNKKSKSKTKSGGSAMRKFTKAMSKINPMSIALSHKKSRNFMEKQGDLTRDYYLPELVSIGIPVAQNVAAMGSTILTGNPVLGRALFDATYKNMVTDKGYDPRDQSKSKKINKASKQASAAISGKVF
jgi:curved DNA-binding protein CbpA